MKRKIFLRIAFLLTMAFFIVACTKSDIEKARDAYDATKVVPVVQGMSGSASVLQTFAYDYTVTYDRSGSTWAWTGVGCTVQSVSADTKTATVLFSTIPAGGAKAKVQVAETTPGGKTSPVKDYLVTVSPFCPLAITGFVGAWGGTDGYSTYMYPSEVVTSAPSGTTIKITGLNRGWIFDYWGETITAGGTVNMTVNPNGTTVIADQYLFTTDYAGDPYIYWIKGTGIWGNCGAKPTLTLSYNVYYKSDGYTLPSNSNKTLKFTATLVLGGKGMIENAAPVKSASEIKGLNSNEKRTLLAR
jgi:hypothetical protein